MSGEPVSVVLVGVGGYGNTYVNAFLDAPDSAAFRVVAAVDPAPRNCRRLGELQARGVPLIASLDEFYASHRADLACVSTPIQFHASQTCQALAHGSHVLLEKPLCVTPDEARRMVAARDAARRLVAVGYQWSFSRAIHALKADVLAGKFGRPRRLKNLTLWPRDEAYYARSPWAGAQKDARGNWVLDSPVNNACAHHLHNMLYVTGARADRSARPVRLRAELYRAHPIENYDTACLRGRTDDGVELLFIASHATDIAVGPTFTYEFERGTVEFTEPAGGGGELVARMNDGTVVNYGVPTESRETKIWRTLADVREGRDSVCPIEAAAPHTQCVWAGQQSVRDIATFPPALVRVSGETGHRKTTVEGLGATLERCYAEWRLPSEVGPPWAVAGNEVTVEAL